MYTNVSLFTKHTYKTCYKSFFVLLLLVNSITHSVFCLFFKFFNKLWFIYSIKKKWYIDDNFTQLHNICSSQSLCITMLLFYLFNLDSKVSCLWYFVNSFIYFFHILLYHLCRYLYLITFSKCQLWWL